jgi:putative membrane-bound dehydrogenase-like protein
MDRMRRLCLLFLVAGCAEPQAPPPPVAEKGLLSPAKEHAAFRLPRGFEVNLVAAEPDVVDPVAMAFDEHGRLYVVEMPGFPNGDTAEGTPPVPGRIRLFENPDKDHRYRKCTVFADGLTFPTSVMPYKKGVLVACAPEILYLEDTHGDGRADVRRVLYTGFGRKNIEAQVNSLQWGLDNWVYGLGSFNGGEIRSPDRSEKAPVLLQGRGFRFRPEVPGSLEPTLARGQYGLAADAWGRWFTCTNNEHLTFVVLEDRYISREPLLAAPPAVLNIPDHGAAAKLYRESPFESWRVERTSRRAKSEQRSRFPATELVPGGYVTSACGLTAYEGGLFPPEYEGNVFVCDPANNVVHRDVLDPAGALWVARRAPGESEREFLASTDPCCRPVNLTVGPDGALYVADFYREVIEGASFIPEDIKTRLGLKFDSAGRGRIWRIAPSAKTGVPPGLGEAETGKLVLALSHSNAWCRLTAQRLLVQDQRRDAIPAVRSLLLGSTDPFARLHALWTLQGLGALEKSAEDVLHSLKDPDPGVREHAIRIAEDRLSSPELGKLLLTLVEDPSARVRFQLAFTLGQIRGGAEERKGKLAALSGLAVRDGGDPYPRAAILSSAGDGLLELYVRAAKEGAPGPFLADLSRLVGARLDREEIGGLLLLIEKEAGSLPEGSLSGLAQGIRQRKKGRLDVPGARDTLSRLLSSGSPAVQKAAGEVAAQIRTMTEEEFRSALLKAKECALDETRPVKERAEAVLLLGQGEWSATSSLLGDFLLPRHPESIQRAAAEALGAQTDPAVAGLILERWRRLTPAVREKLLEILFDRKERLKPLLEALSRGDLSPGELDSRRRAQLVGFPDPEISRRAQAILKDAQMDPKLFEDARGALALRGDAGRGRTTFKKLCITCHQAGGEGAVVGPALASVRDNPPEEILKNILYPSLVIAPQYAQYLVEMGDGQVLNGLIVESSEAAITLRRQGADDSKLLRRDIKNLVASRVSLMPEDLLKGLGHQDIADLIKFVQEIN